MANFRWFPSLNLNRSEIPEAIHSTLNWREAAKSAKIGNDSSDTAYWRKKSDLDSSSIASSILRIDFSKKISTKLSYIIKGSNEISVSFKFEITHEVTILSIIGDSYALPLSILRIITSRSTLKWDEWHNDIKNNNQVRVSCIL